MAIKEIEFRKKRELGEIISDSFEFLKQEYKPVSRLIITYVLPFLILYGVVQVYMQKKIIGNINLGDPESLMANIGPIYLNIFLFSLFGIFVHALLVGVYFSYIEAYVKKGKGNFDLSEISHTFFNNGLLALGASIVIFVIVMLGLVTCIIPGIYFAVTFSLVLMIVIFERKGLGNAMARSWNLVNRMWWNTLLLSIVGIVIIWAVGFVFTIPSALFGAGINVTDPAAATEQPQWFWILSGISTVVSSLFWIIPNTFLAFQYFNLDERTKTENRLGD